MLQPKKPVVKKTKSVSERLGDITLRDIKNAGEDTFQLITLGGYGKIKKALGSEYKYKEIGEKKYGGKISKAKNGKSFPDLNKDGKITKADILKGRGVIAKKGATVKKAQYGGKAASMVPPMKKGGTVKAKMGASIKKAQTGNAIIDKASKDYKSYSAGTGPKPALSSGFKNGGSMKKCKYGCK